MSAPTSSFRKAWLKWKSMRLPWRRRFLVGLDLQGNTYWEFRDTLSPGRMRRIVDYPPHVQYSDVSSHITPAWHQWLRHTRQAAPTIAEQELDVLRRRRVKVLAAQADERWEAKGRLVGGPNMKQMGPGLGMGNATAAGQAATRRGTAGVGVDAGGPTMGGDAAAGGKQGGTTTSTVASGQEILDRESERMKVSGGPAPKVYTNPRVSDPEKAARREPATPPPPKGDPWKNARGGPSEDWQPQAWSPGQATRR
ncbi:hypothetical protein VC83_06170 [Pseudogymnoascus destructans]|nr:uncharacterized protein VC83_06170 [Pseudogymnoascus destructans]OAF58898.1 hypothetical protein VC83_06170 [Pseudogymnoascus destructans]